MFSYMIITELLITEIILATYQGGKKPISKGYVSVSWVGMYEVKEKIYLYLLSGKNDVNYL